MIQIVIEDLEVWLHVGVTEEERSQRQRLLLTLEMNGDFFPAAKADELSKTIDYHAVTRRILGLEEARSWKLIEALAKDLAQLVIDEFGADHVKVEVKKFILPETRCVKVRLEQSKVR